MTLGINSPFPRASLIQMRFPPDVIEYLRDLGINSGTTTTISRVSVVNSSPELVGAVGTVQSEEPLLTAKSERAEFCEILEAVGT